MLILALQPFKKYHSIIESFQKSDESTAMQISILTKPTNLLLSSNNSVVSISSKKDSLVLFRTKTSNVIVNSIKTIAYLFDDDLEYLKRINEINKEKFEFHQIKNNNIDDNIKNYDLFFIHININDPVFKELNNKFAIYEIDVKSPLVKHTFPFAQKIKVVNVFEQNIVELISVPNVLINNKYYPINETSTAIYNAFLKKDYDERILNNTNKLSKVEFNSIWWNQELVFASTEIKFVLKRIEFENNSNKKILTIKEKIKLYVGDRVLVTNQIDINVNDYYYVIASDPLILKNYLTEGATDEFDLISGDKILRRDQNMYTFNNGIYNLNKNVLIRKDKHFDCLNIDDYSINTFYKTKEACESEFDYKGEKRIDNKTIWFKRCKENIECEHYNKSKNIYRGGCVNGFCEQPIKNKFDEIQVYENDKKDYVFENDSLDRINTNLHPILNI
jgi:hypothetical protein